MVGVCKECDSKGDSDLSAALRENGGGRCRAHGRERRERRERREGEENLGFIGRRARLRGCGGKASVLSPPPVRTD
jgi:hypothetical protein